MSFGIAIFSPLVDTEVIGYIYRFLVRVVGRFRVFLGDRCLHVDRGTQILITRGLEKMRKLKYHEQKLLKKVDFVQWKSDGTLHEAQVLRRYRITNRDDYQHYAKIVGQITKLANILKKLPESDEYRIETTKQLLRKLYVAGLIDSEKSLLKAEQLTVSALCRRRLPVILVRSKMSENLKEATTYIEQGQVRVGPNVVTDPAFMVTRSMEDFVTWVDSSKIRRAVDKYNDKLDDFDLLGA
jgi:U3 small nucleolar ribonucleoprotein protein IMP3